MGIAHSPVLGTLGQMVFYQLSEARKAKCLGAQSIDDGEPSPAQRPHFSSLPAKWEPAHVLGAHLPESPSPESLTTSIVISNSLDPSIPIQFQGSSLPAQANAEGASRRQARGGEKMEHSGVETAGAASRHRAGKLSRLITAQRRALQWRCLHRIERARWMKIRTTHLILG